MGRGEESIGSFGNTKRFEQIHSNHTSETRDFPEGWVDKAKNKKNNTKNKKLCLPEISVMVLSSQQRTERKKVRGKFCPFSSFEAAEF